MIEPYIRPLYQTLLGDPLARIAAKTLTPNTITFLGVVMGLGIAPALFYKHTLLALSLLALTGLCDTLDGTVARLSNKTSSYGTALDIVGDRIVEFSILLGLYFVAPTERALDIILMLGSILLCITSFLVVGILSENTSTKGFQYSPGLIERPEAFLFFAGMIAYPPFFEFLATTFSLLVLLTTLIRMIEFKRYLKRVQKP